MEKKLDALNEPTGRRKPFWWWMAPLLLLLLGTGAFIWWRNTTSPANIPEEDGKTSAQITLPSATDTVAATSGGKATAAPEKETTTPALSDDNTRPANQQEIKPSDNKNTAAGKISVPPILVTTNNNNNNAAKGKTVVPPAVVKNDNPPAAASPVLAYQEKRNAAANAVDNNTADNNILDLLANIRPKEKQVSTKLNGASHIPVKESVEKSVTKQTVPQRKGFSIGVMVGPVLNIAPSMQYGRIGVDAGLLLSYHLNNRWSFTTGAVYSIKPYGGTRSDYGVTKKWSPPMSYVKNIDANCDVLDIPLNINYAVVNSPKYTLGITAGLSSYLMLKEKYEYKYDYWESDRYINNENRHYFSILNLAFTYQFPLNSHMSLGLQPYAKIPLKAVGFGEVRLYSTGVAVQLNFNQTKRK
ncbi:outer membrane beta-barrel protein [Chitinophaga agrisoli]|nr:outer membrane beta-barrel protein [Chitinophaga agrisoli]